MDNAGILNAIVFEGHCGDDSSMTVGAVLMQMETTTLAEQLT
jgi:hypothetical protein